MMHRYVFPGGHLVTGEQPAMFLDTSKDPVPVSRTMCVRIFCRAREARIPVTRIA